MANVLWVGSDKSVLLSGLTGNGDYLNAAAVTWTLTTSAGVTVATGSLAYTAASDGDYAGVIEDAVTSTLTAGQRYYLRVDISQGDFQDARKLEVWAAYRGET